MFSLGDMLGGALRLLAAALTGFAVIAILWLALMAFTTMLDDHREWAILLMACGIYLFCFVEE